MMENIKTCLTEADPNRVKLYFIERDKNQRTKEIMIHNIKDRNNS
ncbi:hypothetical protein ig2599ANME_1227 [groundwater metagenome]